MRKVRYLSSKTIKGKKRITEYVEAELTQIRYIWFNRKTKREKIVKFDPKKKLRVEVVFKIKSGGATYKIPSSSYGLPYRVRKKPTSEKILLKQIKKKHLAKLKKGHLIVNQSQPEHNLYSWTYYYQAKTKKEIAEQGKKRRQVMKKLQTKGSRNAGRKFKKNKM